MTDMLNTAGSGTVKLPGVPSYRPKKKPKKRKKKTKKKAKRV